MINRQCGEGLTREADRFIQHIRVRVAVVLAQQPVATVGPRARQDSAYGGWVRCFFFDTDRLIEQRLYSGDRVARSQGCSEVDQTSHLVGMISGRRGPR